MKNKSNNKKIKIGLLILILCITIGYALLRTALNINGIATIPNVSWDVHFDNYQKLNTTNIEPTTEPSIPAESKTTTISYAVAFTEPGDLYEFTVDAVNDGTIDAMIESISSKLDDVEIDNEHPLPAYLDYSVTYVDGTPIQENQLLASNSHDTYKVKIGFKDVDPSELPEEAQVLHLDLTVTYIQADDNAIDRRSAGLWVNDTKISDDSPAAIINAMLLDMESRCFDFHGHDSQVPISNDYINTIFIADSELDGDYVLQVANGLTIHGEAYIIIDYDTGDSSVYAGVYSWPPNSNFNLPSAPTISQYLQLNNITLIDPQVRYNGAPLEKSLETMVAERIEELGTGCAEKLFREG